MQSTNNKWGYKCSTAERKGTKPNVKQNLIKRKTALQETKYLLQVIAPIADNPPKRKPNAKKKNKNFITFSSFIFVETPAAT